MLFFIGLDLDKIFILCFKKLSFWFGFIGLICVSIIMVYFMLFLLILECISFYIIMIWEIIVGFVVIRNIISYC